MNYIFKDGILTIQLSNGSMLVQDKHPQTNEPITDKNLDSVIKACLSKDDFIQYQKNKGIEFEGVMCSATAEDQNGLIAVLMSFNLQQANFKDTLFTFSNGNTLVLSLANMPAFTAAWLTFRQSFFLPEVVE